MPTMGQLQYMEYQDENGKEIEVRILDKVKPSWINLANALSLPQNTEANEKAVAGWTPEGACRNVFSKWLNGSGVYPLTWPTLLKALKKLGGYKHFIGQIKYALDAEYKE